MKKIFFLLLFLPLLAQAQLELPFGVKVLNPEPLDAFYYNTSGAPYTSTSQVTSQIPSSLRYIGQTVNINNIEYWFGSGVLDANLVIKGSGNFWPLSGTGTLTGETTINGAFGLNLSGLTNFAVSSEVSSITTQYGFEVNDTDGGGIYFTAENAGGMGFVSISNSILIDSRHTNTNAIHLVSRGGGVRLNSSLSDLSATPVTQLHLTNTFATFTDNRATKAGLEYAADYSATFTNRSLVDKAYVDSRSASLTSTFVGYGDGSNVLTGESSFTYDAVNDRLTLLNLVAETGRFERSDATTNSVLYNTAFVRNTSGTAAIGIGTGLNFFTELSNGSLFPLGTIEFVSTNVTSGSEDSDFVIKNTLNGSMTEKVRVTSDGILKLSITPTTDNSNGNLLSIDGSGNVEIRTAASITTSPAGSDTQIQYNGVGSFAAEAAFTYNATTNSLLIANVAGTATTTIFGGEIQLDDVSGSDDLTITNLSLTSTGTSNYTLINNSGSLTLGSSTSIIYVGDSGTSGNKTLAVNSSSTNASLMIQGKGNGGIYLQPDGRSLGFVASSAGGSNGTITVAPSNSFDAIELRTNDETANDSRPVTVRTGTAPGGFTSGTLTIETGDGSSGNSGTGNLVIGPGLKTGSGTQGALIFQNIPTSSAGLPSGAIWSNAGVLTIVP